MANQPITVQGPTGVPDNLPRVRNRIPQGPPPSLDENVFTVPLDYEADPNVLVARNALKGGKLAAEKALEIARATLADETLTLHARHMAAQDLCHRATAPAVEKIQNAIDKIFAQVKAEEDFLKGPKASITPATVIQIAEARGALNRLPPAERRTAILQGIEANDPITCAAVTRCPSYLVGCTDIEMADFANRWATKHHPTHVAHLRVLKDVLDHTERGGKLLLVFTHSLSSTQITSEARRLSERAATAVRNAGIQP